MSDKVSHFTESVIREMTRQAMLHGAINLAQGFPDFDGPEFAKEAAVDVLRAIGKGEAADVDEALSRMGLTGMSDQELAKIIDGVMKRNRDIVRERGDRAFSVLMGEVMKVARGKVDGQKVSGLLKQAIEKSG